MHTHNGSAHVISNWNQIRKNPSRTGFFDCQSNHSHDLISSLVQKSIIIREHLAELSVEDHDDLQNYSENFDALVAQLVEHGLLTKYQGSCIISDGISSLLLGNYRILDRLGTGGMGEVYKAEHIYMRRLVAIKVLSNTLVNNPLVLQRFQSEIRAIAQLQHPNIVSAFDAGKLAGSDSSQSRQFYFVMEYVDGLDLEQLVQKHTYLDPSLACDIVHQIASALVEAHAHTLVHRDIKPSNIIVTKDHRAKLLDFGLAMSFNNRLTEPGTVLGTLDYLAPEQAKDASKVDIRVDIYGLGGILYWCLTGKVPFPSIGNTIKDLANRINQSPPSVRKHRSEIMPELECVVKKMLATFPENRYQTPQEVQFALRPFLSSTSPEHISSENHWPENDDTRHTSTNLKRNHTEIVPIESRLHHVLIVDDESSIRDLCRLSLQSDHLSCDVAGCGQAALDAIAAKSYDLILLDVNMKGMNGFEVCKHIRQQFPESRLKIILFSGSQSPDEMAILMSSGVHDYLSKPFSIVQLRSRVQAALRLKDAQERMDWYNKHLTAMNQQLETNLGSRGRELLGVRDALIQSLARVAEFREDHSGMHLLRMQSYCPTLARAAGQAQEFAGQIDDVFIKSLAESAPLHDIGKITLPDYILFNTGQLEIEDRVLMQTHASAGAELLEELMKQHPSTLSFLHMAVDIARHHHERFDGKGYPGRLAGNDIPLAARIVAIADAYDSLRTARKHRSALGHDAAVQVILETPEGQFDPTLLTLFEQNAHEFDKIFNETQ